MDNGLRQFTTGATRDTDQGKLDYEAFLSPLVLRRFAQYMHRQGHLPDGSVRPGDNWQLGIPRREYAKSLIRHLIEFWLYYDGFPPKPRSPRDPQDIEEVLCAIIFNAQGYLFETIRMKVYAETR